jgi:DNA phosphorothioation-dependent restriction protein DptH
MTTSQSMTPFRVTEPDAFYHLLTDTALADLDSQLHESRPGNCLRVSTLPVQVMRELAERLYGYHPESYVCLLIAENTVPADQWEVRATQLVALRNAEDRPLLVFIPPGLHTSAEDSFDISTFVEVHFSSLGRQLTQAMLEKLPEHMRLTIVTVLDDIRRADTHLSDDQCARYLLTVSTNGATAEAIGRALYHLDLIPDPGLLSEPNRDAIATRLKRNRAAVLALADPSSTLLSRIYKLKLEPGSIQTHLYRFLSDHVPENVAAWGQVIATQDEYRDLALDRWPFLTAAPECLIYAQELKLPLRRDSEGVVKILDPTKTSGLAVSWELVPEFKQVPQLDHFRVEIVNTAGAIMYESGRVGVKKAATRTMSYQMKDIAGLGLEEDVYYLRVRAYTAEGAILNREDRGDPDALRNPRDLDGKRVNETEDFLFAENSDVEPTSNSSDARYQGVSSYSEARFNAQCGTIDRADEDKDIRRMTPIKAAWQSGGTGVSYAEKETFTIRFSAQSSYTMEFSGLLTALERQTIGDVDALGRWRLDFSASGDTLAISPEPRTTARDIDGVPPAFTKARRALFAQIAATPEVDPALSPNEELPAQISSPSRMITAVVDLRPFASAIKQYLTAYQKWLTGLVSELEQDAETTDRSDVMRRVSVALDVDVVRVMVPRDAEHRAEICLLAPTHPLRLWWHLQCQHLANDWVDRAVATGSPKDLLTEGTRQFVRTIAPRNIPYLLQDSRGRYFADAGALTPFWQLYIPTDLSDSRATRARVEYLLGLQSIGPFASTVNSLEVYRKIWRYLNQHPYVSTLKLNVFNPGDARLVVEAIVALHADRPTLKYEVNLFSEEVALDEIGDAFNELLNPSRQVSDAREEFTQPSRNHLFPKLRFSRNRLRDFAVAPERFSAHVSLLLSLFPPSVCLEHAMEGERSSYIHGLVQEPITIFAGRDGFISWYRQLNPGPTIDLAEARGATGQMAEIMERFTNLQASISAGRYRPEVRPTVDVRLDLSDKSLLYQIHDTSDWVLTVDSNLGLDYFDAAPAADRPLYLLDFTPEYLDAAGERLVLTTRSTDEVFGIITPALTRYGINAGEGQEQLFLHLLRSLSGRLVLRLLAMPAHVDEALSLALTQLFLEQYHLLGDRVVIPLDAHINLFAQARREDPERAEVSMRRSDLLLVEAQPETRTLIFHVVEVKSRRHGIAVGLEDEMEAQLSNAMQVLRQQFDTRWHRVDRLDRQVKTKELMTLLAFYLERARRYRLVSAGGVEHLQQFFSSLDEGYKLQFRRSGLIFDLTRDDITSIESPEGTNLHSIGANYISRIVQNGLRSLMHAREVLSTDQVAAAKGTDGQVHPTMEQDPTYLRIRTSFTSAPSRKRRREDGTTSSIRLQQPSENTSSTRYGSPPASDLGTVTTQNSAESAVQPEAVEAGSDIGALPQDAGETSKLMSDTEKVTEARSMSQSSSIVDAPRTSATPPDGESEDVEEVRVDVLLGDTRMTTQYGVLGSGGGHIIGLDLDGVNTVSLFGVQGAGKSYTMGTIIEMATQPISGLNRLPHPLASVIFHYHESQDYAPEFVSMVAPNDHDAELRRLREEYGAEPIALSDVIVLTTTDKLATRRAEFPSVSVYPLLFRSDELSVRDWLFLMGAVGNQSMYITQINRIMRASRDNLTLETIRAGIEEARLSDAQKELAATRLDFAAEFIDDANDPLASKLRPGRLVIVDLRDELVQKDQALGLFGVMLNIFAAVGTHERERYNKFIVFDEAHKYMTGGDLTEQVVSTIRQMRHQGVSVLIASQDPLSLPGAVIELSSIVMLHRFNSPSWLKHIQKSVTALGDLKAEQLAMLKPGEAYVWANKSTEPIFSQKAVKIRLRPRATLHGGSTKTAG